MAIRLAALTRYNRYIYIAGVRIHSRWEQNTIAHQKVVTQDNKLPKPNKKEKQ